jgi:hypothetical protein
LALKHEKLASILSTGTKFPGKNRSLSGVLSPKPVHCAFHREIDALVGSAGMLMVAPAVEGIDLFKIAGRSISGWIPRLKTGTTIAKGGGEGRRKAMDSNHQESGGCGAGIASEPLVPTEPPWTVTLCSLISEQQSRDKCCPFHQWTRLQTRSVRRYLRCLFTCCSRRSLRHRRFCPFQVPSLDQQPGTQRAQQGQCCPQQRDQAKRAHE